MTAGWPPAAPKGDRLAPLPLLALRPLDPDAVDPPLVAALPLLPRLLPRLVLLLLPPSSLSVALLRSLRLRLLLLALPALLALPRLPPLNKSGGR